VRDAASWLYERTGKRLRNRGSSDTDKTEIGRADVVAQLDDFIDSTDPFFSFVHLMDTHVPYQVETAYTQDCLDRFDYENISLETVADRFPEDTFSHNRLHLGGRLYDTAKPWEDSEYGIGTAVVTAQYDASVRTADDRVGRVLELLRDRDVLDETLVFLLADHGESLTEHDIFYDHHGLYDVSVQVPLIVRPPGGCGKQQSDEFVQITDIAPTIGSYTDLSEFRDVDGSSLRPVMEDGLSPDREVVMAEEANTQRRRMIRTTDEKFIYSLDDDLPCSYCGIEHAPPEELYEIESDPAERTNQADESAKRSNELREMADSRATEFSSHRPDPEEDATVEYEDEEQIHDRLEALGYR